MYKLLIVDDEPLERNALRLIVQKNLPLVEVVGEARNGNEAVALAESLRPHIILMDIKMPEKSGLEAGREIRSFLPKGKIVFLSAFEYFDYAQAAMKAGGSDYLLKPIRPKELLAVVEKLVQELKNEEDSLKGTEKIKEQLEQIWPFIKTSFIYDLINGNIVSEQEILDRGHLLGLTLGPAVVELLNIDNFLKITSGMNELEKQLMKQKVFNIMNEVFPDKQSILMVPFMSDKIIILIGKKNMKDEYFLEYCREKAGEGLRRISRQLNITVTIGIGNYYDDVTKIRQSYIEAVTAQRQGAFFGKNQVTHYSDLKSLIEKLHAYPFAREEKLLEKVRLGNGESAKKILQELWEEISSHNLGEELQKACALELLVVIYRAAVNGGANLKEMALLNLNYIEDLTSCHTGEELELWLIRAVDRFIENVWSSRMSSSEVLVQAAKNYINENFYRDIKLDEVAQFLHFGPHYLSRVFKQHEGITFKKYVTDIKLEYAKKMLLSTRKTISEIAKEVGYEDISYFSRVFKQVEGISPHELRSK